MDIRAYKIVSSNGDTSFASKTRDGVAGTGYCNIENMALGVKDTAVNYLRGKKHSQVSIDLFPFHDIECPIEGPSGLVARLCVALSEEERQEFWKYYNS